MRNERKRFAVVTLIAAAALAYACNVARADEASSLARAVAREAGASPGRAEYVIRHARAALEASPDMDPRSLPLLLAIAIRESNLKPDVESCATLGDGGRAVGLYQEHARGAAREALCAGGAAVQAVAAVRHLAACGASDEARIACYAGRSADHPIVRDRLALAARLERAAACP